MVQDEQDGGLASFVASHLRRNFTALSLDFGTFGLGMTFASATTILPAFAERLGASNLVIGAIPSIVTLGYTLPALFFANHAERLSRKLRFLLVVTVWERLPLLFLAVATFLLAERWPGLMLLVLLLSLMAIAGVGGALTPAWMDLIGKVIPARLRGRLFAFGNLFSTSLGLGGAIVVGYFLQNYSFPLNYTLCFGTGFMFFVLSFISLALVAEPELPSAKPKVRLGVYFRRLPEILRRDRDFAWYLVHRAVGICSAMANGFYAVFALRVLGAPEWQVAQFTLAFLAGQTVANLLLGYLADRWGHKPVLAIATSSLVIGNGIALLSTRPEHVYFVFVCMAFYFAGLGISSLNISLEFAPAAERPTYIGLSSTLLAPFSILASLVGGVLADLAGYHVVFAIAGLAAALSTAILIARVRDPRAASRLSRI